ncbi:putative nucleotidyltransferase substrate binding domain-containing protein [Pseudonocardia sp. CA-107938]|uniref:putative nucleotidyltransferase substrate binding domain-containing protein n=1 Tax=Pseudonocardia sp. CA-107938 TaxID=3240021 RepID=UPI003D89C3C6
MDSGALAQFLAEHPPFDSLDPDALAAVAAASKVQRFAGSELVVDAFTEPTGEVFVVVDGQVELWNSDSAGEADEFVSRGGVFGFSAMLTERSMGPRAVAAGEATVARIPASVAAPAFASRRGAAFLVEAVTTMRTTARERASGPPTYSLVDDLIVRKPLVVGPREPVGEVARRMTDADVGCAVVLDRDGARGVITDAVLRRRVVVEGMPADTPAEDVMDAAVPTVRTGESAVEAQLVLLDREAEYVLVTTRDGEVRGVLAPRDFAISPTTAGVALHQRLRRAGSVAELTAAARGVPTMLSELLARGLASGRVIAVYSAMLDTVVRRAIEFVFRAHEDLCVDAFTWLSLGSNGRREAVPSSDVDSAVAFDDSVTDAEIDRFRAAFVEVQAVLVGAGLSLDEHGATAGQRLFARTNAQWRAAGQSWLAAPERDKGALLTSLMVDARPIHGDPGLPAVTRTVGDLRRHPGTMRLLLQESLARRARGRPVLHLLSRRPEQFDIKQHALLPVVNMARWAALSVGSHTLSTTERLRTAAGSAMLPDDAARMLIEVFEVLQRVRLRYQLRQVRSGERPSDLLAMRQVSSIDRSVIAQAVREIAAVQRRMDNVSHYVPVEGWTAPEPAG